MSLARTVTFGAACRTCPLRERCTTAKTGSSISIHPRDELMRAHRARAGSDPGFAEVHRSRRPMVERSIAWLVRKARRVPYRGMVKNDDWLHHRVAAVNLPRLLTLRLPRTTTGWALPAT